MTDIVVRCAREADLPFLVSLAEQAGPGMTNLPADSSVLEKKIHRSLSSFAKDVTTSEQEFYFFVMEEQTDQQVVGCCAILAKAGCDYPFYSYKVGHEHLVSTELGVSRHVRILYLVHDYSDATEVCSLFLAKPFRGNRNGEFLSRMRFLYLASFPERFSPMLMAEMRGVIDSQDQSPFWESLGQHFFAMDFAQAHTQSAYGHKQFIIDLMPRCPIYVPLLKQEAQDAIGVVHPDTQRALALLKEEGFHYEQYIDIFDGGPTIQARLSDIKTVKESKTARVSRINDNIEGGQTYMVANQLCADFRVSTGRLTEEQDGFVIIEPQLAKLLNVVQGDNVRYIPFARG